jgi:hypothetical protein
MPLDSYESGEFADIEERLIARFSPPLRPDEVQRRLVETVRSFEEARIRTYLAVLIERAATEHLLSVVADAPGGETPPPLTADVELPSPRMASASLIGGG